MRNQKPIKGTKKVSRSRDGHPRTPLTLAIDPRVEKALLLYCDINKLSKSAAVESVLADFFKIDLSVDASSAILIEAKNIEIAKLKAQIELANKKNESMLRELLKSQSDLFSMEEG
jgi:hypothetical protein